MKFRNIYIEVGFLFFSHFCRKILKRVFYITSYSCHKRSVITPTAIHSYYIHIYYICALPAVVDGSNKYIHINSKYVVLFKRTPMIFSDKICFFETQETVLKYILKVGKSLIVKCIESKI